MAKPCVSMIGQLTGIGLALFIGTKKGRPVQTIVICNDDEIGLFIISQGDFSGNLGHRLIGETLSLTIENFP